MDDADDMETQVLKFKNELLGLFIRWLEESDIEDMHMIEAAVEVLNRFAEEPVIEFEADPDILED